MSRISTTVPLAFVIAACADVTAPLDPANFVGRYPLRTVNGLAVPQTVPAASGCSRSFQFGSLNLADDGFILYVYGSHGGCSGAGVAVAVGPQTLGGAVTMREQTLLLRAVNLDGPAGAAVTLEATISGAELQLRLPPGFLNVADSTTVAFGPREPIS